MGILRDGVIGIPGGNAGGPSVTHHIKCVVDTVVAVKVEPSDQAGRERTGEYGRGRDRRHQIDLF